VDTLQALRDGFANALTPAHLLWALVGTTLGTAIGVLPGIGPALTVAVLLPITFSLDPVSAFIMFGGIYYGAMYGGSTTSILLNTPGETGAIATAIDGHQMARQGRGAAALTTAAVGSFVAGTLATIGLTFFAPALASVALQFGPAEYFGLAIVAFCAVAALLGDSVVRGLFSLFMGLALGLVGIDQLTGAARFSFGIPQLLDGIDVVILVMGLFAVGEVMFQGWRYGRETLELVERPEGRPLRDFVGMSREEWQRSWKPWLRGTAIGFPLGVLPVGGSVIPTFLAYMTEKRLSDRPERFGHGAIEGVAAPEAANNAAAAGVLVPLLTLGLPSSATAAILLAAFQQYGLQPGPLLFSTRPDLVWTLIARLYIGNVMLLVLNLPLAGVWARVMLVPRPLLFAGVLVLASLGAYSLNRSLLDLGLLYVVGGVGCLMRIYDFPLPPAVLGLVLGPLAEQQFRRALAISEGDYSVFLTRPITATLLAAAAVVLAGPWAWHRWRARAARTAAVPPARPGDRPEGSS
jgi:putative tricarboxylic transport membrane protein